MGAAPTESTRKGSRYMTPGARRDKARRLPTAVAEALAVRFGLTIEAAPPTKPGKRPSGAVYVGEGAGPDLRIRASGQPGADVALLTDQAMNKVTVGQRQLYIEAKNDESWRFDAKAWKAGELGLISSAFEQCRKACRRLDPSGGPTMWTPAVVLGRNHHVSLVAFERTLITEALMADAPIAMLMRSYVVMPLDHFVRHVVGEY